MYKKYFIKNLFLLINLPIFIFPFKGELHSIENKILMSDESKEEQISREEEYILGIGDILNIKIFDSPEDSRQYTILNDGTVNIGLIGRHYISGKTINEATYHLRNLLKKELLRPDLQISIEKARNIKVSMIGQIQKPGIYDLSNPSDDNFPTLITAIQKAGGITNQSDLERVVLIRKLPDSIGGYKEANINLLELINNGEQIYNPYLFDGDIIKLTKLSKTNLKDKNQEFTNLYPEFINVYVIGKVQSPGAIKIPSDTSLIQSIYFAGGPINSETNKRNIELIRIDRDGKTNIKRINLDISQDISSNKNPLLSDGDIIKVNSTLISKGTDSLNTITGPFRAILPIFQISNLLNN